MPASYLSKHRPICDVLNDIRVRALAENNENIVQLCNEAIRYAQRMSAKLQEYKEHGNGR